jgi:hypothetical protein
MNVEELYRCEIQKTPNKKQKILEKIPEKIKQKILQKIQKKGHFKT